MQFEHAAGTRSMTEVYSKGRLVVPLTPKGELMLVRAEEAADRRAPIKA